jgi:hypothetical protein
MDIPAALRQIECRPSAAATSARLDYAKAPARLGCRSQRTAQDLVLDVVAERFQPKLVAVERHFGRADQSSGCIYNTKTAKRSGMLRKRTPCTERIEHPDRTIEEGCRAPVRTGRRGRKQHRFRAGRSERQGRYEAGRAAPDNRDFCCACSTHWLCALRGKLARTQA